MAGSSTDDDANEANERTARTGTGRDEDVGRERGVAEFPSDEGLVARMAEGDERALAMMIERHEARLYAFALRHTGVAGDTEEVVASAFHALWRKAGTWSQRDRTNGPARPSTWLHRVVLNAAIDRSRRRRLRRWVMGGPDDADALDRAVDTLPTPEYRTLARDELRGVLDDLRALPGRQRAAILLAGAGHGVPEIAAIMGAGPKAVEQMLVRARRTLRAARDAREEEGLVHEGGGS